MFPPDPFVFTVAGPERGDVVRLLPRADDVPEGSIWDLDDPDLRMVRARNNLTTLRGLREWLALAPGRTLGEGIEAMEKIAANVLDDSFETDLNGPSRDFRESSGNTSFAFMLALALIYLILAAQFESFRDPFIIMLTVPLAIAGAYLSLWATDNTMNIFSQIGMIMLIGLVTKNGILIVEFANQKRDAGMDATQAVFEAAQARLRPILMTTLATVLGAMPIALSLGAASTSRIGLGVVVVGGLLFSLLLTLFVIPAMYTFMTGKRRGNAPWSKQE